MRQLLAVAVIAIASAACTPYADRLAATCARLGIPPGSPNYFACIQHFSAIDAQDRAMWGGIAVGGAAIAAQPQPTTIWVVP